MNCLRLLYYAILPALLALPAAQACSVPVFRYALERWENAPYRVVVFSRGELAGDDNRAVETLRQAGDGVNASANIRVESIDVETLQDPKKSAKIEPRLKKLWASMKDPVLPLTVLLYPEAEDELKPIWSGRLAPELAGKLLSSPVRKEISQRLSSGHSAVWVLLQTGDKSKDDAASALLGVELEKLQKSIRLPSDDDTQGGPAVRLRSDLPLKIEFSILPMSRSDPEETMFVAMLSEMDAKFRDAAVPVAYPVFGRGRALAGLSGKELTPSTIEEATMFLAGACSCQVKELNPGVDLLFDMDWDGLLSRHRLAEQSYTPAAPLPKLPDLTKNKLIERNEDAAVASDAPAAPNVGRRTWLVAGTAFSGALALASGIWLIVMGRRRKTAR